MNQIKIIQANNTIELQHLINQFLKDNIDNKLIDIKMNVTQHENIATIIYETESDNLLLENT